jgi:stage II sporulation protein AA (anti-sigma F factor antagonist)
MHWTEIAERIEQGVVILDLRGHMTLSDDQGLLFKRVGVLADHGHLRVLLNLRHIAYVDSVGIGEIIRAYMRLTRSGGALKLCAVAPRITEVLEATNLNTVLAVYASEEDALRSFAGS